MVNAYEVRVTYTNKSGKGSTSYIVLANNEADALRLLIDSRSLNENVSTFTINTAPHQMVIYRKEDGGSIMKAPGMLVNAMAQTNKQDAPWQGIEKG